MWVGSGRRAIGPDVGSLYSSAFGAGCLDDQKAPSADSGCKEEMTLEGSIGKV